MDINQENLIVIGTAVVVLVAFIKVLKTKEILFPAVVAGLIIFAVIDKIR